MVGAANCSMKNDVCNSFTYLRQFRWCQTYFCHACKIFSNQQRQYLLRVCVYSHHGGKLIWFFFFFFNCPFIDQTTLIIKMTIDEDELYLRRSKWRKEEKIRFLKGDAVSYYFTDTLPGQLTHFPETLIWIKGWQQVHSAWWMKYLSQTARSSKV